MNEPNRSTDPFFSSDPIDELLDRWHDGVWSGEDARQLEALLSHSAGSEAFLDHQMLAAALGEDDVWADRVTASSMAPMTDSVPTNGATRPASATGRTLAVPVTAWAIAASIGFVLASFVWFAASRNSGSTPTTAARVGTEWSGRSNGFSDRDASVSHLTETSSEPTATGVAFVSQWVPDRGDTGSATTANAAAGWTGRLLEPGDFELDHGCAQIEFFCGARLIVEAPASLELVSAKSARVHSGRLRVSVPPAARGFTLFSGDQQIVDLGTEFGLDVTDGKSEVLVYQGEVEVHQPDGRVVSLLDGQTLSRQTPNTTLTNLLDQKQLNRRATRHAALRMEQWNRRIQQLSRDPRVAFQLAMRSEDFEQRSVRPIPRPVGDEPNRNATHQQASDVDHQGDVAIVGAEVTPGRWPGKSGVTFRRPGDRMRLRIDGQYDSFTMTAWVRIDRLDRWYNSLLLTDNYDHGEPHWQILDSGQLFLSLCVRRSDGSGPEHREVLSPVFWDASLAGRWMHLASRYDAGSGAVTHFVDGQAIHREVLPRGQRPRNVQLGDCTLGNWTDPQRQDPEFAIRNLNGCIDEFVFFSDALSDDEIEQLHLSGQP